MVQYLITAVKLVNGVATDLWELYTYDDKREALKEAKRIAEGACPTIQALNGFTDIVVNECFGDEVGNCLGYTRIARFKIL